MLHWVFRCRSNLHGEEALVPMVTFAVTLWVMAVRAWTLQGILLGEFDRPHLCEEMRHHVDNDP